VTVGEDSHPVNTNADVTRRPSKRQLEKAPEGRQPRMPPASPPPGGDTDRIVVDQPTTTHDVEGNGNVYHPETSSRFRETN
jgi:hypothetical protein